MSYKYIIFDLDGTISDPSEGIHKCINYALEKLGEKTIPRSEIYKYIGPPLKNGIMQNLGFNEEKAIFAVKIFRERYNETGLFENQLIDGAEQLIKNLFQNGKTIAIATSKVEEMAVRITQHFGLKEYFTFIGGAEWDVNGRNKKTDILKYVIKKLDACDNLSECVMIGDRHHDIDGARNVGINSIGVMTGFGNRDEFKEANFIAETLFDLEKYVL